MNLNRFYVRKGWATSVLDIPVRDSNTAREIETLVKEAESKGLGYERMSFVSDMECKTAEPDKEKTALVTASTESVDRDQEVVDLKGLNLKLFNKSPVILWSHDYSAPPIGKAQWTKVVDDRLKSQITFAKRPSDWSEQTPWFADQLHALAQQGILKGVSIGFMKLDASSPTEKEIKARPELATAKRIIRKSQLLEISLVAVGANQDALIETVSKGLATANLLDLFGIKCPTNEPADIWQWETKDFEPETPTPSRLEILKRIRPR